MEKELDTTDIILGIMSHVNVRDDNSEKDAISTGSHHFDESEMSDGKNV